MFTKRKAYKDDVEMLQALLDKRGKVVFPSGRFEINRPLVIHSDTSLVMQCDTVLHLCDGANCSLLDNDGLYTHTTNRNISIEGGVFDGNHDRQKRQPVPSEGQPGDAAEDAPCDEKLYISNIYIVLMVRLVHTERLIVKNVTFKNPTSYAVHIADANYFHVENVTLDYDLTMKNMDGVHIQGPARFGKILNVRGNANDDHVALCANGTVRSEITRGDIEDVDIDGVYCSNGYTGVRLLSRGDAIRNISIRNVHGAFRYFAVSFTHHYLLRQDRPILLENVHISDCFVSKSTDNVGGELEDYENGCALFWFESDVNAKNVTLENVFRNEKNEKTKAPTLRIDPRAKIDGLTVQNVNETFPSSPIPTLENRGEVKNFTFDGKTM